MPLRRILSVSEILDDDKKKFKKLAKAPDIAFKVLFHRRHLVKGDYVAGPSDSEVDEEIKGGDIETWYLVCESKQEQEFWIDQLVLSGKQLNPRFEVDEDLEHKTGLRT